MRHGGNRFGRQHEQCDSMSHAAPDRDLTVDLAPHPALNDLWLDVNRDVGNSHKGLEARLFRRQELPAILGKYANGFFVIFMPTNVKPVAVELECVDLLSICH